MQQQLFIGRDLHPNSILTYREKIIPTLTKRQQQVYDAIVFLGGKATCFEVAAYLGVGPHVISGRFTEMKKDKIKDTGENKRHGSRGFTIWEAIK